MLFERNGDYYKLELSPGLFDRTNDFKFAELNIIVYDFNYKMLFYKNYGRVVDINGINDHNKKLQDFIYKDKLFVAKVGWCDGFQFQKNKLYFFKTNKRTYDRGIQFHIELTDSELNSFKEEFKKLMITQ